MKFKPENVIQIQRRGDSAEVVFSMKVSTECAIDLMEECVHAGVVDNLIVHHRNKQQVATEWTATTVLA